VLPHPPDDSPIRPPDDTLPTHGPHPSPDPRQPRPCPNPLGNHGRRAAGYPPETALTLGRFVAGSSARAKARRLGISDEKQEAEDRRARAAALKPRRQMVRLLGRDIPVLAADDGTLRAEDDGKPSSVRTVRVHAAGLSSLGPRHFSGWHYNLVSAATIGHGYLGASNPGANFQWPNHLPG